MLGLWLLVMLVWFSGVVLVLGRVYAVWATASEVPWVSCFCALQQHCGSAAGVATTKTTLFHHSDRVGTRVRCVQFPRLAGLLGCLVGFWLCGSGGSGCFF
jgi:hypothetical protein